MFIYISENLDQKLDSLGIKGAARRACSLFFSTVAIRAFQRGDSWDDWVSLSAVRGRRILTTRHYDPAVRLLLSLGAIETDDSYSVGEYSKGYRIAPGYRSDIRAVELKAPQLEKRLAIEAESGRPKGMLHDWLADTWGKRATLAPTAEQVVRDYPYESFFQRIRFEWCLSTYKNMNNYTRDEKTGRVYYAANQMPRALRNEILIDNEPTIEVDIACSQPRLAACLYPLTAESEAEKARYLSLCDTGLFYESLRSWSMLTHLDRDDFKAECFRQVFFGGVFSHGAIWDAFMKSFPILGGAILKEKQGSKNAFALRLQSTEARAMIDGAANECAERQIPILAIHDGFRCKVTDSATVVDIVTRHWRAVTGDTPRIKLGAEFLTAA
jgi:hypothetical protein